MRHLIFILAAMAVVMGASPSHARSGYHNYNTAPGSLPPPPPRADRRHDGPERRDRWDERRAIEIQKECRMFAYRYWRYHPDYQHCRYR